MFDDLKKLLFNAHSVKYLVVGGYAVSFHAQPRATQDLDFQAALYRFSIGDIFLIAGFLTFLIGTVYRVGDGGSTLQLRRNAALGVSLGRLRCRRRGARGDGIGCTVHLHRYQQICLALSN
jgi:hypothetical protein